MVQRKLTNKLSIDIDRININRMPDYAKPSSLHHHLVKNGGADLKKKMKKSGKFDSPRSPNLRRHVKQPGKPPPTIDTTPRKQTIKPNYMKSTTSSDARKEKVQVINKTSPETSTSSFLKLSLPSSNKAIKTTSSYKMMRTPSFKQVRNMAKKCSPVAFCEVFDVQKATCSSTLKDRKFPAYLTLSPGGTESEGTSAMKVCPYTYCSLNGHHHAPLPPLKSFLSAKRRMLKTQRNIKLGCLSPRRARPVEETLNFELEIPKSHDLEISLLPKEEQSDFFVEIYCANKEDGVELMSSVHRTDETGAEQEKQDQTLNKNGDLNSADIKVVEEVSEPSLDEEETKLGFLSEVTVETNMVGVQSYEEDSEVSDTDWESGHQSAEYLDDFYEYPSKAEKDPDLDGGKDSIVEEEFILNLENSINTYINELLEDEIAQESFDEDGLSTDTWSTSDGCESIDSYDYNLQNSNNLEASAATAIQMEEPEAAPEDKNDILLHCDQTSETGDMSFGYLKDFYLPKDDEITNMGKVASEIFEGSVEEMGTCDIGKIDVTFKTESNSKAPGLDLDEVEFQIVNEVMTENEADLETDDASLSRAREKKKNNVEDLDELGNFNPRGPNFLPLEPEPDSEKVDLRHQDLDERKNAEEWMVDYALRQTVTKLGAARKRKVALLVEAFEKVLPDTKDDTNMRHSSAFKHARPMQSCN